MQEAYTMNWAEDAFNSLRNETQFFEPFYPIIPQPRRESTPSLFIDSRSENTTSPRSPITPQTPREIELDELPRGLVVPKELESLKRPRRKGGRVSKKKNRAAPQAPNTTESPEQPRTERSRKNLTTAKRRGRPTTCRVHKDKNNGVASWAIPDTSVREVYLEKNRRAAQRCRERKKIEQEDLCKKAQDKTADNVRLKHAITTLQEEAFVLKTELLRHANCGSAPINHYLEQSAKRLAEAGLKQQRASMTGSEGDLPTDSTLSGSPLSRFPSCNQEAAAHDSRPSSKSSRLRQDGVPHSEQFTESDTTPPPITAVRFSSPKKECADNSNRFSFSKVPFGQCDGLQSSTIADGVERIPSPRTNLSQWATI